MPHLTAMAADILSVPSILGGGGGNNTVATMKYGLGANFDGTMQKLIVGFLSVAWHISVIMTAVAGVMVAFGLGEANRFFWNWILGIGLALNFGGVLINLPGFDPTAYPTPSPLTSQDIPEGLTDLKSKEEVFSGKFDYLSLFMLYYTNQIIIPGANAIVPVAARLLIAFTVIEGTIKVALNLIEGDKVKFFTELLLKNGFYLFLIQNWLIGLDLTQALGQGFQEIGFLAGGNAELASATATAADAAKDTTMGLKADSIFNNAMEMFNIVWEGLKSAFSIGTIGPAIASIICIGITVALLILTSIEMFMARLEFYTMALLTIPLIPFAAISQLNYLFRNAFGAIINLSIKVSVIAFIQAFSIKLLSTYVDKLKATMAANELWKELSVLFQMILVALIIYFMTKKIPELVSGLLNGTPSFSGASMMQTAKSAVNTAGKVAGAVGTGVGMVAAAGAAAGASVGPMSKMASWGGTGSVKGNLASFANAAGGYAMSAVGHGASLLGGTAKQLGKAGLNAAATRNPVYQGYQSGVSAMGNKTNGLLTNPKGISNAGGHTASDLLDRLAGKTDGDDSMKTKAAGAAGGAVGSAAGSAAGEAAGNAVAGPVGGAVGGVVGGMAGEKVGEAAGESMASDKGSNGGVNLEKDGDKGGQNSQKTAPKLSEQVSNAKKAASNAYQPIKRAVSNPGQTVNNMRDSARQTLENVSQSAKRSFNNSTLGKIMDTTKRDDKEK